MLNPFLFLPRSIFLTVFFLRLFLPPSPSCSYFFPNYFLLLISFLFYFLFLPSLFRSSHSFLLFPNFFLLPSPSLFFPSPSFPPLSYSLSFMLLISPPLPSFFLSSPPLLLLFKLSFLPHFYPTLLVTLPSLPYRHFRPPNPIVVSPSLSPFLHAFTSCLYFSNFFLFPSFFLFISPLRYLSICNMNYHSFSLV